MRVRGSFSAFVSAKGREAHPGLGTFLKRLRVASLGTFTRPHKLTIVTQMRSSLQANGMSKDRLGHQKKKTQDNLTVSSPRRAGVEAKSNQASQFQAQVDPGGAEALPDQGPLKASLDPCSLAARPGELLVMPCYLTR